jgi:hypothetical protein
LKNPLVYGSLIGSRQIRTVENRQVLIITIAPAHKTAALHKKLVNLGNNVPGSTKIQKKNFSGRLEPVCQ